MKKPAGVSGALTRSSWDTSARGGSSLRCGQCVNGLLADRSNIRASVGRAFVSAAGDSGSGFDVPAPVCGCCGRERLCAVDGGPASVVGLARWINNSERGPITGVVHGHNLGEARDLVLDVAVESSFAAVGVHGRAGSASRRRAGLALLSR
jgi:sugar phosphate permease